MAIESCGSAGDSRSQGGNGSAGDSRSQGGNGSAGDSPSQRGPARQEPRTTKGDRLGGRLALPKGGGGTTDTSSVPHLQDNALWLRPTARPGMTSRTTTVAWAEALVITHKMGCCLWHSASASQGIHRFRLAIRSQPDPPVVIGECVGCEFRNSFGSSAPSPSGVARG
jgi:hypothetical protein